MPIFKSILTHGFMQIVFAVLTIIAVFKLVELFNALCDRGIEKLESGKVAKAGR